MNKSKTEWIEYLNAAIKDAENYGVLTRDSGLQKEEILRLGQLVSDCGARKVEAIAAKDEDFANLLLGFECVVQCLSKKLEMWITLKEEKPDVAWDNLVAAQMAASAAARAHIGFSHLIHQAERLEVIEKIIFPPQVFVSAGLIVGRQECSVCGEEYGECDHLAGVPYWGKFCHIVARDIEADHIALVTTPADKRCRVMQFSTESGFRNRMTWKIEPSIIEPTDSEDAK
jgi:hypothetical protein